MHEKIHCFGQYQNLHGIYTPASKQKTGPCVLIINAGAVHKVGPFDLHVKLARHLSDQGVSSFRFDLSGQGDSLKVASPLSREAQILEDMRQALDFLEQEYEHPAFVSFGLCTGAENAHKLSVADERIKGVIWIDGYGYLTSKFKRVKILKKLSNPFAIIKAIFNRLSAKKTSQYQPPAQQDADVMDNFAWKLPDKAHYIEDMNTLHSRATRCLYIYSGGVQPYYNYLGQMKESLAGQPFVQLIEEAFFPKASHTFFILDDRNALFSRISKWLDETF